MRGPSRARLGCAREGPLTLAAPCCLALIIPVARPTPPYLSAYCHPSSSPQAGVDLASPCTLWGSLHCQALHLSRSQIRFQKITPPFTLHEVNISPYPPSPGILIPPCVGEEFLVT